eukprot:1518823-Rhodomonas_salina.1
MKKIGTCRSQASPGGSGQTAHPLTRPLPPPPPPPSHLRKTFPNALLQISVPTPPRKRRNEKELRDLSEPGVAEGLREDRAGDGAESKGPE